MEDSRFQERMDALTMNLELASRDIQDLRKSISELAVQIAIQTQNVNTVATNVATLAMLVASHEKRIGGLESERN